MTVDQVRLWFARGANVINKGGWEGQDWPLREVARKGNLEVVRYLLSQGVNPKLGLALSHACFRAESTTLQIVQVLIEHGADINEGDRALICAAQYSTPEVVKYLIGKGAHLFVKAVILKPKFVTPATWDDALVAA